MIVFENLKYKNFISTGNNGVEIDFIKSPNTLIIGDNGAGKSTVLDALTFVLFSKPFRTVNRQQLLNSINGRECVIEIIFSIGNNKYKVIRGIKPNIFEIYLNGKMLNQDAKARDYQKYLEQNILKLNYKSFTQIVVLGNSSFVPFMQLSAKDRRIIIEDLLDIQIFSLMNVLVKQKMSALKESITTVQYDFDLTTEKISLQNKHLGEWEQYRDNKVKDYQQQIDDNQIESKNHQNDITKIQEHIGELSTKIVDRSAVQQKSVDLESYEKQIYRNHKKVEKEQRFFEKNENCPTCSQDIAEEFKNKMISDKQMLLDSFQKGLLDLRKEEDKLNKRIKEIDEIIETIKKRETDISNRNSSITAINEFIAKIQDEISKLQTQYNGSGDKKQLADLQEQIKELSESKATMKEDEHYHTIVANLLKDTGIKTKIIKQYLPIMNKLVNKYLGAMDFFVNFTLDENFTETIKSRNRDAFSYASFSEGEKMRIDLSLLFTWREIAKMRNSTNTNLLILDEVFDSSLDIAGTEEFLKLIHSLGQGVNVFIISHKSDTLYDKFTNVLRFDKVKNFTRVT